MVSGNVLEIAIPKTPWVDDNLSFEFKWNDNMQHPGDIMDFYVNGDTAPEDDSIISMSHCRNP